MKPFLKYSLFAIVGIFAVVGLLFSSIFVAMQFGWLNVKGSISARNQFFLGTSTTPGTKTEIPRQPCANDALTTCEWNQTPEWEVVKGGLTKDEAVIHRAAGEVGVQPRMVAAVVIPEQIRFFTSEREVFKRYFEPLKILGSLSQFSLGVSGIKQETANQIEQYANDSTSPFYPGAGLSDLIAYAPGANHDTELYKRLTNDKDHYYSYLYTALYIKEIEAQWAAAGFDIRTNPEAVVTLFNIGFQKSHPNPNPQAAGAPIAVGGQLYAFGVLGANFYHSDELNDFFPGQ